MSLQWWPSPDKVRKWSAKLNSAVDSGSLCPGEASKLAGALNWSARHMFRRLGRALSRPLYAQARAFHSRVGKPLELSLRWWREVLQLGVTESRSWCMQNRSVVHPFADARSEPPRVAAALLLDFAPKYSDWQPTGDVLRFLQPRGDEQILLLKLLSIAFGLSTFGEALAGKRVFVWEIIRALSTPLRMVPQRPSITHAWFMLYGQRPSIFAPR